jgi:hypothetical protein
MSTSRSLKTAELMHLLTAGGETAHITINARVSRGNDRSCILLFRARSEEPYHWESPRIPRFLADLGMDNSCALNGRSQMLQSSFAFVKLIDRHERRRLESSSEKPVGQPGESAANYP